LDEKETVAKETVTIRIHSADGPGRAVDVEVVLEAIGGPLELAGTPEDNKGYGGLCLRGTPLFKGAALTTDKGPLKEDATNTNFRWADLSTADLGVTIFVHPGHPGFPIPWLVRNSYAGVLNPSWPGLPRAVINPGTPVALRYRLYIHRGDVTSGRVGEAYQAYVAAAAEK
ncbi:MAG: PmoA family protein, partial [Candidatus Aminicenantes bacterium]|nr:PmoA family protein [Candidatus Aminicenantes bacterium]